MSVLGTAITPRIAEKAKFGDGWRTCDLSKYPFALINQCKNIEKMKILVETK
jgi:hypothetical protein